MVKDKILLSLIFPSYNEAKNLSVLLSEFNKLLNNSKIEIIIVENGSKDNTKLILKKKNIY